MANINLLPWREELRKEKTRQFTSMLGFAVILTVAVFVLIHVTISSQISHQQKRNKVLQDEIDRLDVALKEIVFSLNKTQLIVSVAAGITTSFIEKLLNKKIPVVRVMPNTPALLGAGAIAVSGGKYADTNTRW